jgi:cyanophycinase-like exopeptidase
MSEIASSASVTVLQGGGPFRVNDELDRELLADAGIEHVVVLPTADAYEQPKLLIESALEWGARIGVIVEPLMVLTRPDADQAAAAVVAAAPAVFLAGDSANHLRSTLKATPVFDAIRDLLARGGTVIACGASASALCNPMTDQRGGGFALGLGLVDSVAVIPNSERWPPDQLDRAHTLANTTVVDLPTGSAIVRAAGRWRIVGDAVVRGDLP